MRVCLLCVVCCLFSVFMRVVNVDFILRSVVCAVGSGDSSLEKESPTEAGLKIFIYGI